MTAKRQEAFVCTNRECRAEFVVVKEAPLKRMNPGCICGNEMKHTYHSPVLRVLNESERNQVKRGVSSS